jgi:hypothetical protein
MHGVLWIRPIYARLCMASHTVSAVTMGLTESSLSPNRLLWMLARTVTVMFRFSMPKPHTLALNVNALKVSRDVELSTTIDLRHIGMSVRKTMFAQYDMVSPEDDAPGLEPTLYELACQAYYQQQELERQVKKHGGSLQRGLRPTRRGARRP